MQVSLRKAHAFAKQLTERAKKAPLARTTTVSIYAESAVEDLVEVAAEKLFETLLDAEAMLRSAFAIRLLLSTANLTSGIDALLNEKALLDARERLLAPVAEGSNDYAFTSATDPQIAAAKLVAVKERNAQPKGYGEPTEELVVKVAVGPTIAEIVDALASIRKRKSQISDELLALNTRTDVSLDDDTVALLARLNLI